jgi:hypothetical protein
MRSDHVQPLRGGQALALPDEAVRASLGCGNPTALAELQAGFERIGIEPTRVYDVQDARRFLTGQGIDVDAIAPQVAGKFMSAFIRARKPAPYCGQE